MLKSNLEWRDTYDKKKREDMTDIFRDMAEKKIRGNMEKKEKGLERKGIKILYF